MFTVGNPYEVGPVPTDSRQRIIHTAANMERRAAEQRDGSGRSPSAGYSPNNAVGPAPYGDLVVKGAVEDMRAILVRWRAVCAHVEGVLRELSEIRGRVVIQEFREAVAARNGQAAAEPPVHQQLERVIAGIRVPCHLADAGEDSRHIQAARIRIGHRGLPGM